MMDSVSHLNLSRVIVSIDRCCERLLEFKIARRCCCCISDTECRQLCSAL